MFSDAATKYDQELIEGKTYIMSNGYCKVANKRYTTIRHDFCITFDVYANIKEASENDNLVIKGGAFNFTTL